MSLNLDIYIPAVIFPFLLFLLSFFLLASRFPLLALLLLAGVLGLVVVVFVLQLKLAQSEATGAYSPRA